MSGFLRVGDNIGGRFFVVRRLGVGGMSVVWLARSREGGLVAVKEPRLDVGNVRLNIAKLRHEALVLRRLRHEGVVGFVDAFEVDWPVGSDTVSVDRPVLLVLEYVEGRELSEVGRLGVREVVDVVVQLLGALAYIHSMNVIHRDVKPKNVMLGRGGRVKIIDFGTSKFYYERASDLVLSPGGYTAPEQVGGLALPQSDVWSVGATALFLLTGRPPCEFMEGYPCRGVRPGSSLRPSVKVPEVGDRVLDGFLRGALRPNYAERFPTAVHALDFLTKGYYRLEGWGLRLSVKGRVVALEDSVVVGRSDDPQLDCVVEGGRLHIYDPQKYISKRHAEFSWEGGRWRLRDLGSRNGTAVFRGGRWHVLWRGAGSPSQWWELAVGDVVALAFDEERGPYLVLTVVGV